jgi:hypothetical protein
MAWRKTLKNFVPITFKNSASVIAAATVRGGMVFMHKVSGAAPKPRL